MEADAVLREIEEQSKRRYLPIIGPEKGRYLVNAVRAYKVKKVLEVGTFIGYSAILIAKNLPEGGKVFTIEIDPYSAKTAQANIKKANLSDKVEVFIGDATDLLPEMKQEFDMVFLDTGHGECLDYLKYCERILKKGGVVFTDNVKLFGRVMRDFLDYVRNSGRYDSKYIDVGYDGVEISIKLF